MFSSETSFITGILKDSICMNESSESFSGPLSVSTLQAGGTICPLFRLPSLC
jgi:hypothetical protein